MTQFCRCCRVTKPVDQFDEKACCRQCQKQGRKAPRIRVALPEGWTSSDPGLPDLTVPTEQELANGYEGETWTATRGQQKLEVRWRCNHGAYLCRVFLDLEDEENPHEARTFDYPHEVLDWLARWFEAMGPFRAKAQK